MQTRNGGTPTGATCQLIDTIYVPGSLASDLARIIQLHVRSGTMVEIAIATALSAVAPIGEQHVLQTAYLWQKARPTLEKIWHDSWDAFHPVKLSQPRLQYFIWEQLKRAEKANFLRLPPPLPGTELGSDGKTPRARDEPKRSYDFSEAITRRRLLLRRRRR